MPAWAFFVVGVVAGQVALLVMLALFASGSGRGRPW